MCRRKLAVATDRTYETVRPPGPLASQPLSSPDPQAAYTSLIKTTHNGASEGSRGEIKAIYANVPNVAPPEAAAYAEVRFETFSPASSQREVTPRAVANDDVIVEYECVP